MPAPPHSQRCHLTVFHRHISEGSDTLTTTVAGDETSSLSSSVLPLVGQDAGTGLAKLLHPPQWEGVTQKKVQEKRLLWIGRVRKEEGGQKQVMMPSRNEGSQYTHGHALTLSTTMTLHPA